MMTLDIAAISMLASDSLALQLLLPLGLLLITISVFSSLRKRRRRLAEHETVTPRERIEQTRQRQAARHDLDQVMVEVEQLAKRFATQLDAKRVELEELLNRADRRIEQLRQLTDSVDDSLPSGEGRVIVGRSPEPSPTPDEPDDPLARSVYDLADQGLGPDKIASKLNEHVGKVELILALRNV